MNDMPDNEPDPVITRSQFNRDYKAAWEKIQEINAAYQRLFSGGSDQEAVIKEIESLLNQLRDGYESLFVEDPKTGFSKVGELNHKLEEIKNFHKELLVNDDQSPSIQKRISDTEAKIKVAESQIQEFHQYIFGVDGDDKAGGQERIVKNAIKEITDFHNDVTSKKGYKETIEEAHAAVMELHGELFDVDEETKQSQVAELKKEIEGINTFYGQLEGEIKGEISRTRDDITGLLAEAIGPVLYKGYIDSVKQYRNVPSFEVPKRGQSLGLLGGFSLFIYNLYLLVRATFSVAGDYLFFIAPLIVSVFIFIQPDVISHYLGISSNGDYLEQLGFTDRLLISLPLWWISLFGYKNIRNKNRLAEEYNHKAQMSRMYINFNSQDTKERYPMEDSAKQDLNKAFVQAISRNPVEVYGRDDTILDKIKEIVLAWRGVSIDTPDNQPVSDTDQKSVSKSTEPKSKTDA